MGSVSGMASGGPRYPALPRRMRNPYLFDVDHDEGVNLRILLLVETAVGERHVAVGVPCPGGVTRGELSVMDAQIDVGAGEEVEVIVKGRDLWDSS